MESHREIALMVNNDMTSLPRSLRPNNPLGTNNLSSKRRLILVHIHGHIRLIPVWTGLEKILRCLRGGKLGKCSSTGDESGTGSENLFGVVHGFDDLDEFLGLFGGDGCGREAGSSEGDRGEDSGSFGQGLKCLETMVEI